VRRLIINADDFGLTSGVNQAISEASSSGVLTSATIMANSRAYEEAVKLAKSLPALKTGCHIVLIDGEPLTRGLSSLTSGGPRFRSSLKEFAFVAVRGRISADEIQREAEAQIRRIQSSGITVTHVDSHKHTHMFPHVLRPVLRAAKACGVRAARNPFEPLRSWPLGDVFATPGLWLRSTEVAALRIFAAEFRKAVREEAMLTTDGTVGITATGKLDQKMLAAILNALPEGTWELVCHPGYSDPDLQAAGTRLLKSREAELQALTSAETRSLISRREIELISYADLRPD
jgi:hopanoid biosynthesis associated protein HpnK